MNKGSSLFQSELDDNPLVPRPAFHDQADFDITAMIDLVFMMNIFFLVTSLAAGLAEIDLPAARHCTSADSDHLFVITIIDKVDQAAGELYIGDGPEGEPFYDPEAQEKAVREAVQEAVRSGRNVVMIKAGRTVPLRNVVRISAAAVAVEGTELKLAVVEKE